MKKQKPTKGRPSQPIILTAGDGELVRSTLNAPAWSVVSGNREDRLPVDNPGLARLMAEAEAIYDTPKPAVKWDRSVAAKKGWATRRAKARYTAPTTSAGIRSWPDAVTAPLPDGTTINYPNQEVADRNHEADCRRVIDNAVAKLDAAIAAHPTGNSAVGNAVTIPMPRAYGEGPYGVGPYGGYTTGLEIPIRQTLFQRIVVRLLSLLGVR